MGRDFDVSRPWLNRVLEGAPRRMLKAVDGVSLEIRRGETLALVGESGCGKSTVARLIVGLYAPSRGGIEFDGVDMTAGGERTARARRRMQMIFQDPYASLNPRWRVARIVAEPLRAQAQLAGDDGRASARRASCCSKSGCRPTTATSIRTSSPAGSASASASRARCPRTRSSWCATNRPRRWTCRCRRRSST